MLSSDKSRLLEITFAKHVARALAKSLTMDVHNEMGLNESGSRLFLPGLRISMTTTLFIDGQKRPCSNAFKKTNFRFGKRLIRSQLETEPAHQPILH